MRKKRYFAEGGGVREGRNENIDDDTRERAMRYVNRGTTETATAGADRDRKQAAPKAKTPSAQRSSRDTGDETARLSARVNDADRDAKARAEIARLQEYDKPLERVLKDEDVLAMALPLGPLARGARALARPAAKTAVAARPSTALAPAARPEAVFLGRGQPSPVPPAIGANAHPRLSSAPDGVAGRVGSSPASSGPAGASAIPDRSAAQRALPRPPQAPPGATSSRLRSEAEDVMAAEGGAHFRRGGLVKARGDGIAQRGRTKGRFC